MATYTVTDTSYCRWLQVPDLNLTMGEGSHAFPCEAVLPGPGMKGDRVQMKLHLESRANRGSLVGCAVVLKAANWPLFRSVLTRLPSAIGQSRLRQGYR